MAVVTTSGVALAAGPTISASVSPNTAGAHSKLKVSATGPFTSSSLPTSIQITVQKGFRSSAKSVAALCSPSRSSCPTGSKIGSGQVVATVSILGQTKVPFTLYLGKAQQKGDIASIVLTATVAGNKQKATGRLFTPSGGGLEMLFSHLPSLPSGFTATLDHLSLQAHAVRKVGSKTYSLITNPPTCATGQWTGSVTLQFQSGPVTQPLLISCRA